MTCPIPNEARVEGVDNMLEQLICIGGVDLNWGQKRIRVVQVVEMVGLDSLPILGVDSVKSQLLLSEMFRLGWALREAIEDVSNMLQSYGWTPPRSWEVKHDG